jgi:uncharacterized protein (TIGR03435 family)
MMLIAKQGLIAGALCLALTAGLISAQSPAADRIEFEVASVKPSKSGDLPANSTFPLGPGSVYVSNGGHFSATNLPLAAYIAFAYKIMGSQQESLLSQLPGWGLTDHFDIQARTDGNPAKDTKDQMRLMMRSLLADRFRLAMHNETRQGPVFALTALRPGKTGPLLRPHPNDSSCSTDPPPPPTQLAGPFPALCGGLLQMPPSAPGLRRFGGRNITMAFIANILTPIGTLDRPVLDQTGLTGTFDFALEWAPELQGTADREKLASPRPPGAELPADIPGPAFMDAVRQQLGLKLERQKGPIEVLVLDHVERPSQN